MRKHNTFINLINYFSEGDVKKLTANELKDFWQSLSNEEKEYYTYVDLETGLLLFWR